jgi:hypothetical protein
MLIITLYIFALSFSLRIQNCTEFCKRTEIETETKTQAKKERNYSMQIIDENTNNQNQEEDGTVLPNNSKWELTITIKDVHDGSLIYNKTDWISPPPSHSSKAGLGSIEAVVKVASPVPAVNKKPVSVSNTPVPVPVPVSVEKPLELLLITEPNKAVLSLMKQLSGTIACFGEVSVKRTNKGYSTSTSK